MFIIVENKVFLLLVILVVCNFYFTIKKDIFYSTIYFLGLTSRHQESSRSITEDWNNMCSALADFNLISIFILHFFYYSHFFGTFKQFANQ